MKLLKYLIFILIIQISCVSLKHTDSEAMNHGNLKQTKTIASNEELSIDIPMLTIVDSSIYEPLDSIIQIVSECRNFSPKLRNLITFLVLVDLDKDSLLDQYRIFPEPSNKTDHLKDIIGGFYYKGHLFKVKGSIKEIAGSFYDSTNCSIKIPYWNFKPKKFNIYMPFAIIKKIDGHFHLVNENLCGKEIYVTGD